MKKEILNILKNFMVFFIYLCLKKIELIKKRKEKEKKRNGTEEQPLVLPHSLPNLTNSPFPPNDILVRTRFSRSSYEIARNHLPSLSLDVFLPQNRSSTKPLTLSNSKNHSLSTLMIFSSTSI